jgi:hypothetical protein
MTFDFISIESRFIGVKIELSSAFFSISSALLKIVIMLFYILLSVTVKPPGVREPFASKILIYISHARWRGSARRIGEAKKNRRVEG